MALCLFFSAPWTEGAIANSKFLVFSKLQLYHIQKNKSKIKSI